MDLLDVCGFLDISWMLFFSRQFLNRSFDIALVWHFTRPGKTERHPEFPPAAGNAPRPAVRMKHCVVLCAVWDVVCQPLLPDLNCRRILLGVNFSATTSSVFWAKLAKNTSEYWKCVSMINTCLVDWFQILLNYHWISIQLAKSLPSQNIKIVQPFQTHWTHAGDPCREVNMVKIPMVS